MSRSSQPLSQSDDATVSIAPALSGHWIGAALWIGLVAACGRAAIVFAMERLGHGTDLSIVSLRLSATLPTILLWAVGLAGCGAFALALTGAVPSDPLRWLARSVVWVITGLVWFGFLSGRIAADASQAIGGDTERGRLTLYALAFIAAFLAFAPLVLMAISRRRDSRTTFVSVLVPVGLALALHFGLSGVAGGNSETMRVRTALRSLIASDAAFTVHASHEQVEPHVGVLCPSADYRLDGADMPCLVIPPPGEVGIDLDPDEGPVRLVARAGLDRTVLQRHGEELAGRRVRFEVLADGQLEFEAEIEIQPMDPEAPGSEWISVGGAEGLALKTGANLRLRTTLLEENGDVAKSSPPLLAGFGGMRLERHGEVERTLSSPERPNIVLIVMDTLRADRLATYGYERPTSPELDALAARGLVFDEAHATSSWTWPSTASILTGMLPEEHGVQNGDACFLADEFTTLAEVMQSRGMTTACWSGNPLIVPDRNFNQGFEYFDHGERDMRKSRIFMPNALEWIAATGDTRFFLYLHLTDPHGPHDAHPRGRELLAGDVPESFSLKQLHEYNTALLGNCGHLDTGEPKTDLCVPAEHQAWISQLYDACVWTGDYWLGRVLAKLEEIGIDDRTIVVFTSDHGEELFEHGLVTHGQSLYREQVRVPLVMAGPGIPAGKRVAFPTSNRHLATTLAGIAGGELSGLADSLDLLPLAESSPERSEPVFFSTTRGWWNGRHPQQIFGLRQDNWILHYAPKGGAWGAKPGKQGDYVLYDLSNDERETVDRSQANAELVETMRRLIEQRAAESAARRPSTNVQAGPTTLQMLRDLGYIGEDE